MQFWRIILQPDLDLVLRRDDLPLLIAVFYVRANERLDLFRFGLGDDAKRNDVWDLPSDDRVAIWKKPSLMPARTAGCRLSYCQLTLRYHARYLIRLRSPLMLSEEDFWLKVQISNCCLTTS